MLLTFTRRFDKNFLNHLKSIVFYIFLLQYVLKRKDLTKDALNALDCDGISPLLGCAIRGNSPTIAKVLANKAVKGKIYSYSLWRKKDNLHPISFRCKTFGFELKLQIWKEHCSSFIGKWRPSKLQNHFG